VSFNCRVTATTALPQATAAVRRRVAGRWLLLTLASLVALVGVYVVAVLTPTGQSVEDGILRSVDGSILLRSGVALDAISVPVLATALAALVLVALLRGRPGAALQTFVIVAGSTVTTQLLKLLAPRPELTGELYGNSFPSGHTTIAVALLFAIMTAFGRHVRPLFFVLGTIFAALVAEQTVAYGWHRASDVVGACAVALAWLGITRCIASRWAHDPHGGGLMGRRAYAITSTLVGAAVVLCLTISGAVWGVGIGMAMDVSSSGDGVLTGARLAAAGVVLITAWVAWKLDGRR